MRLGKKAVSEFTSRIRRIVALHKTSWLLATTLLGLACVTSVLAADELYVNPPVAMELTGVPDVPEELTTNVSRYQNVRSASVINWIGESLLIMTRFGDTRQLHLVNSPLGMREQITFADEPIGGALVPPVVEPELLIYSKDVGGSESYQLFQMGLDSRASDILTDGKSRYTGVSFNPSGTKIAYSSTELNGRDTDLFVQDLGGERIVVQQGEGVGWSVEDWSPDEQRILISRYVSVVESELYEVDLSTLERTRLLAEHGAISIGSVAYGASGKHVYFTSYLDGEFARIFELDLESGAVGPRSPKIDWNVSFFRLSRDRTMLAYVVNEGGYSKTHLVNLESGEELALPEFPLGHMSSIRFNHDGSRIAFSYQSATSQADVYVLDLETLTLTRWTKSELGELPTQSMISPELKQYASFDGRQIPVFVYEPKSEGPHPVLIYIHGGPESQYRPRFSATFQFYVNELGVALWVPNVRGSSGYGKTYLGLDNGYLREDSVRDIGALLDFIATDDTMDSSRVGVIGGSYGGYMVLASLVHFNDRLMAGVETVGISNFVTFLENTQDYRRDLRRAEYGDERDLEMRAFLESIAPLNQVEQISTPLLIGQGLNDPRVPASESRQIVDALQSRDIPVWYVLAKDEGHGFRKKPNRDYWWYVVTMFLTEHLL